MVVVLRRVASAEPEGSSRSWRSLLLPNGYPQSVSHEYLRFQCLDAVQGLSSYLRGVLTTQAIMQGLGIGSASSTSLAATSAWVYREGAGMFGGLVFAWLGGGRFDAEVKQWRFFADVCVDAALTLELLSPVLCGDDNATCFTAVVCVANVLKAMCGVAAGATRAAITSHFALVGNTADVQAKEGSQETAVSLLGMVLGLQLARVVDAHRELGFAVFVVLTVVHLVANWLAVRSLVLRDLNVGRLSAAFEAFSDGAPLSPESINARERLILPHKFSFSVGCSESAFDKESSHVSVQTEQDATDKDNLCAIAALVFSRQEQASDFVSQLLGDEKSLPQLRVPDAGWRVVEKKKTK
ncbi:Protein root UVB sensitive 3 [Durusdinium trenchii]|uniref:Protein root UVB sensitive 3 n=1 Tax=Durusdinium trenchii TaxID=1381693 RepID=A0ABP0R7Y5_9DINO